VGLVGILTPFTRLQCTSSQSRSYVPLDLGTYRLARSYGQRRTRPVREYIVKRQPAVDLTLDMNVEDSTLNDPDYSPSESITYPETSSSPRGKELHVQRPLAAATDELRNPETDRSVVRRTKEAVRCTSAMQVVNNDPQTHQEWSAQTPS
jgi:hypothetical protein